MIQWFRALTEELFGSGFRSQNPHNKGIVILHKPVSPVLWRTKTEGLIGLPTASLSKKKKNMSFRFQERSHLRVIRWRITEATQYPLSDFCTYTQKHIPMHTCVCKYHITHTERSL